MSARIVTEASITVPLLGRNLDADGIISDPEISNALHTAIVAFARAIEAFRVEAALE